MEKKFKIESFNKNFFLSLPQSSHLPPSQFFLSLSHSLCDCLLSSFSLFLILSGTAFSSSVHLLLLIQFIFFFSELCSVHHFFCLQASINAYKDMHLRFAVHLSIFLWISFFFLLSQANCYCSLCFLPRSNGFFAWSYVYSEEHKKRYVKFIFYPDFIFFSAFSTKQFIFLPRSRFFSAFSSKQFIFLKQTVHLLTQISVLFNFLDVFH